jgi:hypothetical protein
MPGSFVALLSFPRTVLSLKQSTEPTQVHNTKSLEPFADGLVWTVDLEFDRNGRLYALSHTGQISRILY